MKNKEKKPRLLDGLKRFSNYIVLFINAMLLLGALLLCLNYVSLYRNSLMEENLGNISNLNRSAATNAAALISSWDNKLDDFEAYARLHELTRDEALKMLSEMNTNEGRFFELIGDDYTGYLAKCGADGSFPPLDYSSTSYAALHKVFDDTQDAAYDGIRFAPEFTDAGETALKYFAIYKHLPLLDENGVTRTYTLLLAARAKDVLALLNQQSYYDGQATVLIDADGNYIVSSDSFRSTNFFQYLYVYNDLTLDEKNTIQSEMEQRGSGELYYKNASAVVEDCVYRYERMAANGWYCVTCVPLSSFRAPIFNYSFIVYAVAIMLLLLGIDIAWLRGINRRMRASMLREKEASAAKGSFMSRMSHEIRTPLNAVIGYNIIARNELAAPRDDAGRRQTEMKVMDCLTKSDIASKHLLTIINDVLDMSAIESGRIKVARDRFDFRGLITSLSTIFYSQAKAQGVDFEVIFGTLTEEWFIGDQLRVNQILTNLLSNAVKFTPVGGSVKLAIRQPEAETNASHIHFDVSDTGIGMTQEYLGHIWTPFEQADSSISRRFGGTGLGLSITKSLVDLMGGKITVSSVLGEGTCFSVDLTFERTEQPESAETYDFSGINALIVDDDRSTCEYIKLMFDRCCARCKTVTSGAEAVREFEAAQNSGDAFTLCLVDWRMPEMDGLETVESIRGIAGEDVPMIVLTAYDYSELADRAAAVGVDKFVSKPLFQSSLFDLLVGISDRVPHGATERSHHYSFDGARLLLAEDNEMNMEVALELLGAAGLTVESAWNGEEAAEKFEASPPGYYTAILMDVHMPRMNGHEATRRIRSGTHPEARTIPIIAMTADAFAENVSEALSSGMNDHISKPINTEKLFSVLEKYVKNAK